MTEGEAEVQIRALEMKIQTQDHLLRELRQERDVLREQVDKLIHVLFKRVPA